MDTDTLGRRRRTAAQPLGQTIVLTGRDKKLLAGLRRHSPLPTHLAFEFWRDGAQAHFNSFQDRMKKLFHGTDRMRPLVERPPELNPLVGSNYEPAWYQLSPFGEQLAPDVTAPLRRRDPLHHRGMGACATASFELLAGAHGLRFVHREEIFSHPKAPPALRAANNPLAIAGYEPDDLFGFERAGKFSFYVAEFDRGTESFTREDKLQTSVAQKIDKLTAIFSTRTYQAAWGIPNLKAMFLFTSERRVARALQYVEGTPHADRFLFKAFPTFERFAWRAPREPMADLFTPWQSTAGAQDGGRSLRAIAP